MAPRDPWHRHAVLGVACVALLVLSGPVHGRDMRERAAFKRANPCPSTGLRRGSCPGFVVDHIRPLCAGGADRPGNMQWQERTEAARKDVEERRECRALRRSPQVVR